MMCGMPCPKYVRAMTLENKYGKNVDVEVHFNSGQTVHYNVGNQPVVVEKQINQGQYTIVDAILNFNVNFGEGQVTNVSCQDAKSIEKRIYVINPNKQLQRTK